MNQKNNHSHTKTAVVTGGSRNIGFAIAEKFHELGYRVAILSVSGNSAQTAAEKLDATGKQVIGIQCDVTDEASVVAALEATQTQFGGIDIVVNSAGLLDMCSIEEMTADHWDNIMETNVRGTFTTVQKAIPYLEKSPAPRIINISSNAGRMGGFENGLAYSASKGAVIALTYGRGAKRGNTTKIKTAIPPGKVWDARGSSGCGLLFCQRRSRLYHGVRTGCQWGVIHGINQKYGKEYIGMVQFRR